MKIYVDRVTSSIARDRPRRTITDYEEVDFAPEYTEYMHLRFDHLEFHRASVTAWFREFWYDEWNDTLIPTERFLPMRIEEFQKLLLQGRDLLHLVGFFGFRKQGSSVGIELRAEGYGV